jgi:SAM-dependent methyltransferase
MRGVRLRALLPLLPSTVPNLPRHYLNAALGRYRRQVPYDPKRFFDSVYGAAEEGELDDRYTISHEFDAVAAKYHYNMVENSIILAVRRFRPMTFPVQRIPRVLDIGAGSGHWIDFYLGYYYPSAVYGLEIAEPAVEFLERKYADVRKVHIVGGDVTAERFELDRTFQVINAIGVLFHVVEDAKWHRALANLARLLTDDGILIVGGQFGASTQNVQTHKTDEFGSWEELKASSEPAVRVNKRLRSLRMWKAAAKRAGLEIRGLQITKRQSAVWTPENNLLVLGPSRNG